MNEDQFAWWKKALEVGEGRELSRAHLDALTITHEPQSGFYRRKNKGGMDQPVAIWLDNGDFTAATNKGNGLELISAADVWTWCCRHPISEALFRSVAERGEEWPDALPIADAVIGHNLPTDPKEALELEFAGEQELALEFLKSPVTTDDEADKAAVWAKKLADISKRATNLHKAKKQPFLDGGRAVDDEFRDLREQPDELSKQLKRHVGIFLQEKDRKERERQAAARAEAERIQREADEAAAKAAQEAGPSEEERQAAKAEAERLQREADEKVREAEARNASAGRTGAKVSLRTFVSASITDFDALLMALKDRPEVQELVQSLANRAARASVSLPGMEIIEERRAA